MGPAPMVYLLMCVNLLLTLVAQCYSTISLSLRFCCKFTRNSFQYFSETSSFWLMNYSLSALSARIYPIVDFEVVGTLIYNGLSGFAL